MQEYLREKVKMLKWKYDVDYKFLAVEILNMNYNAFLNFVNGYKELGYARMIILNDYITKYLNGRL